MVVIDDQPEVTVDDPLYIFDGNDGFQEVMSKKTQKERQKALLEEQIRRQNIEKKKKEKEEVRIHKVTEREIENVRK